MYSPRMFAMLVDARDEFGDVVFLKTIRQLLFEQMDSFDIPNSENLLDVVDSIDNAVFEASSEEDIND